MVGVWYHPAQRSEGAMPNLHCDQDARASAPGHGWFERGALAVGGLGLVTWLGNVLVAILEAPSFGWNNARLAPSVALALGYPLYSPPDSGPVLDTIYGPVTALAYLPAAAGGTPTAAMLLGACVSALWYYGPALAVFWRFSRGTPRIHWSLPLLAVPAFGLATAGSAPLAYSAHRIHADAPALGLLALACLPLLSRRAPHALGLAASAVCAVLAVWAKQSAVLGLLSLQVFVALALGRGAWRTWAVSMLGGALASAAVFLAAFDPAALLFNMVEIPSHHPLWDSDAFALLLRTLRELGEASLLEACVLCGGLAALPALRRELRECGPGAWIREHPWVALVFVGLGNLPTAVASRMKWGGDVNAFSFLSYFLLIAALLLLMTAAGPCGHDARAPKALGRAVLAGLCLALTARGAYATLRLPTLLRQSGADQHAAGFALIRESPGRVYLPNQPLSHLLAEGRLYHFSYGLLDRELGGHPVTAAHFRAGIPGGASLVCFDELWPGDPVTVPAVLPFFPQARPIECGRPGWVVFEVPPAATGPPQR